jgi:hypothetical protein
MSLGLQFGGILLIHAQARWQGEGPSGSHPHHGCTRWAGASRYLISGDSDPDDWITEKIEIFDKSGVLTRCGQRRFIYDL